MWKQLSTFFAPIQFCFSLLRCFKHQVHDCSLKKIMQYFLSRNGFHQILQGAKDLKI